MGLAERFVTAVEAIADALGETKLVGVVRSENPEENPPPPGEIEIDHTEAEERTAAGMVDEMTKETEPDLYPDKGDRPAWVEMCRARGIEVPPRVKTTTLMKAVKAWDIARKSIPEAKVASALAPKKADVDPFGVQAQVESAGGPVVTQGEVLTVMQEVQRLHGNEIVINILKKRGGCSSFGELSEDKYAAVKTAAEGVLNG